MIVTDKHNIPEFRDFRNHEHFANLTDTEFKAIEKAAQLREYKADHCLFDEGDYKERFYLLVEGVVKFERYDLTGDFYFYDYVFKRNEGFPFEGLCCQDTYNFSAIAITKILVYSFPISLLEKAVFENPKQSVHTIKILTQIIQDYENRLQQLSAKNAQDRVEQSLLYLRENVGQKTDNNTTVLTVPITINEISQNASTSRETTRAVMKALINDGKLKYENKTLYFLK